MKKVELVKLPKHRGSSVNRWVVKRGENEIGVIEKFDGDCSGQPYHAYRGIGRASQHVGHFYPADGGRAAAVAAVAN